ncbi:ribosomal-protein-alanine N-acetyltransferase [Legionella israelensis]|uniref:ribosomal protein S18-alanine N-acetyltransferase n=1 Tax=Legionella israelensis TaxID=454 RepID=UPI00117CF7BB|nr:ribosomal protein S18-alanine N-acetyltransferase [Legionella israelensis]QDP72642.1 ribosomal-protein-alanine N-acetyltransferase [Legionella israelensis]
MSVKIRPMKKEDIDAVYTIESSTQRAPWSRSILSDCLFVGYDCRVLELNQNIAGYIICRYDLNQCHILNFCIAKSFQSKGYGKLLLNSVIDSLEHSGIDIAHLEVRPSNLVAINLYKSLGFEQFEIKKDYYSDDNNKKEDAIVLRKLI